MEGDSYILSKNVTGHPHFAYTSLPWDPGQTLPWIIVLYVERL